MTVSLAVAQDAFLKAGINSRIDGANLLVTAGPKSGNLACLTVKSGHTLNALAVIGLSYCPHIKTPDGEQIFYRCDKPAPTRQVCAGVGAAMIGDEIITFPTEGYAKIDKNSFTSLPVFSPEEQFQIISHIANVSTSDIIDGLNAESPIFGDLIGDLNVTEDNVARIFEDRYKDELRYCDAWGRWLQWDESRWKPDFTLLAFNYCRQISRRANVQSNASPAKASFSRGVESFARSSRTFATLSSDWDRNSWLLNTPKGTIDLRDGQLAPHAKSDCITKVCNVAPSSDPHPVFDQFMRDVTCLDDALSAYLQRALGACLSGAIQDHFLLVWIGTGRNGKNTLGDLVTWILGSYAKVVSSETLMSHHGGPQHPTDLANLRGLRIAVSSEVSEGSFFDEARIKSLTGDSEISARYMRQDFFEFPRTHKHLVYGNHRPMLRVVDPAIKKRLHLVPFKADFTDDSVCDPLMPEKLKAEAPQILQWLIDGHQLWLEDGLLKKCSAVEKETASYFEAQSTPDMWIAECCVEGDDKTGSAKELYSSYKAWKEARGEGAVSQTRLGEWLAKRYEKTRYANGIAYRNVDVRQSVFSR